MGKSRGNLASKHTDALGYVELDSPLPQCDQVAFYEYDRPSRSLQETNEMGHRVI